MTRLIQACLLLLLSSTLTAQQPPPQSAPPPPNQVALSDAREHARAGRVSEAFAALQRVTAPAPAILNQLRTAEDFKALRADPRFEALATRLTPCTGPQHREFDFWIGEWEVRAPGGQLLGRNTITSRHGGCVVFEEWVSASGGSGSSFNFYDQNSRQWHQFWVDATGTNWLSSDRQGNPVTLRGGFRDGAMVLTSHPETLPAIGTTRATWRALPDGGVRQTFETSSDGGNTWTMSFDGIYRKAR